MQKEHLEKFFDYHVHVDTRTIFLGDGDDGDIDAKVSRDIIKGIHLLSSNHHDRPIKLYINSFGGCWFNGMAIYDMILASPCSVEAYVIGSAMSMGSLILQAADIRYMYPNATIMVHDGYETRVGDIPQTFVNWAEYSKKMRTKMYKIYADRSGRSSAFWKRRCSADLILTAPEALELGLVDEILGK